MDNLQQNVDFKLNREEVRNSSAEIKNDIAGVGSTAEKSAAEVAASVQKIGVEQKKASDALASGAKRASSGFNGLQNSINQVTRELPAFTFSAQTGFMAISNNIPMVADEIIKLRKENNELIASGQKGKSVLSQLSGTLLSWQTAMSVGVTLLTVYGGKLFNWISSLNGAQNAAKEFQKTLEEVNKTYFEGIAKEKSALDALLITAKNDKLSRDEKLKALKQINQISPEYLGTLTLEKIKTDEGTAALDRYVLALKRKSIEEATSAKRAELYTKRYELSESYQKAKTNLQDYRTGKKAGQVTYTNQGSAAGTATTTDYRKIAELEFKKKAEADKFLVDQIKRLDDYTQQQLEANSDKRGNDIVARNKAFYQDVITTNQSALDALDNSASDFKVKSAVYKAAINDAKENLKAYDASGDTKAAKKEKVALDRILNSRKSLMDKVNELDAEYARKAFDKDDEEVQALKDKFAKMRSLIEDFNKKNPKEAIDLGELDGIKKAAVGDLEFKQGVERSKEVISREKKLYAEYEEYKTVLGERAAKERYGKLINTDVTYLQQLEAKQAELLNSDPTEMTGAQSEYLKWLEQQKQAEIDTEKRAQLAILKEAQTFEQKKEAKKSEYLEKLSKMQGDGNAANREQLKQNYQEELDLLITSENAKSTLAKRMAEEALVLTRSEIIKQIEVLENSMKDISIPAEFKDKIQTQLSGLRGRLNVGADQSNLDVLKSKRLDVIASIGVESKKANPDLEKLNKELQEVSEHIQEIDGNGDGKADKGLKGFLKGLKTNKELEVVTAGLGLASEAAMTLSEGLGGVDTEAGYTLDTIGQLAGAAADLGGAIASGDPSKMISAGIKAVGTLFSIGKKVKEMNAAARKEVADFYAQAISGEREYQDLLAQRALQTIKDNKTALKGITDEIALRKTQSEAYSKESAEIMQKLQGMTSIASESYTHGTWFRKAKVNKTYDSLQGKSFEELSKLLAQGKLEGDAKALVERLKELEQKGYDAGQALIDLAKQTQELFTGTNSEAMTNSLVEMFKNGEVGAQNLADFFKQSMDDAAISIFKNKIVAGAIDSYYAEFAKKTSDGDLTASERLELEAMYNSLTDNLKKEWDMLQLATGSDLSGGKASAMAGQMVSQALTEDTANRSLGIWQGSYDLEKQHYNLSKTSHQVFLDQLKSQQETATNTSLMVAAQTLTNEKLDKIIANTNSGDSLEQKLRNGGVK